MSKKLKLKIKSSPGFTLLEVMVASIVLSLTMAGVASVFILGSRNASMTSNKTSALNLANQTIKMLSAFVADDTAGFGLPEDDGFGPNGWFEAAQRQPLWQSCAGFAGPWGNCYALEPGNHFIDPAFLPADFTAAPLTGRAQYLVANVAAPPALVGWKRVEVSVDWLEP